MFKIPTQMPVKTKFSESLGESRFLNVDTEKDVSIGDKLNTAKRALLTAPRWVYLVEQIDQIDVVVQRAMTLKPTHFKLHLGSTWHLSVSDEMPFVDIRRWYWKGDDLRPTLTGIALTFAQWDRVKEVAKLDKMLLEFKGIESCGHPSQREEAMCPICTPSAAESL